MTTQKLPEIDILRIISILIVIIAIHIPLSYAYNFYFDLDQYGVFLVNNVGIFVSMGSFVFVSGFGLYLNPNNRNLNSSEKIFSFLKKRLIRIFPLYWIAIILFIIFVGYSDIDPLYLMFHFLGLQIIVAPYFGAPMLTLWFIGVIMIYYYIYIIINYLGSIKLIIPASMVILLFFLILNGIFGLVESRFFLYYLLFILGITTAHIYTSSFYKNVKDRLKSIKPVILLLVPLCCAFLGLIALTFLTQLCFSTFNPDFLRYILARKPGRLFFLTITFSSSLFFQLATVILLLNLIMIFFILFSISSFSFVFRTFGLIFTKRKLESAVAITAYSTYSAYLFHRVFLTVFVAILTIALNLNMLELDNFYLVLLFVPFILIFSFLIQKAYDMICKSVPKFVNKYNLKLVFKKSSK
ncbi:MAG: acyltransferase family protein [Candidatus Hodarchaeota archaeon]